MQEFDLLEEYERERQEKDGLRLPKQAQIVLFYCTCP